MTVDNPRRAPSHAIEVRGARVHNLRDVDVAIPRGRLVVLTGVSGSGKSSLAFDTIHAEGRRRYIDGLSAYARQFLDQLERPDVDAVDGLPPTVAIEQTLGAGQSNPRSTVATLTEIHDYLRLMYARVGVPHCPTCGRPVERQTPDQMIAGVLARHQARKLLVLAPLVRGRKGKHADAFAEIRRAGLLRARVDRQVIELEAGDPKLAATKPHDIEAVVDRLVIRDGIRPRLAESLDLALKLGKGSVVISAEADGVWSDRVLSVNSACIDCGVGFEPLEPRDFSFNSPHGACSRCAGLGVIAAFDADLVVPDLARAVAADVLAILTDGRDRTPIDAPLTAFLRAYKIEADWVLSRWSEAARRAYFEGDAAASWRGILPLLDDERRATKSDRRRDELEVYRGETTCLECGGARLKPESRGVTVGGEPLHALLARTLPSARDFLVQLDFKPPHDLVGPPLVAEAVRRIDFLLRVGLDYLALDRRADTLSGGELQRVRLASHVGSGLVGVCYVLDEPTAGLHPRDTERLLATLRALRDRGNTVVVVEHDETLIEQADWLIDLGPGAGPHGGRIVAEGPPRDLPPAEDSLTARYLRARQSAPADTITPPRERIARSPGSIVIRGARARNLKSIDAAIPLGAFVCVAGVSGSGKSTLVHEVLARAARRRLGLASPRPGAHDAIDGLEQIDALRQVDQTPIGRGPRSTPAIYVGAFDEIRRVFARTRDAKLRGFTPARFSFNAKGGRCEACRGQGTRRVEMNFLPDLSVRCEACRGLRFNASTLEIRFKGRSIGSILQTRVDEAVEVFDAIPRVRQPLAALHDAGLGYLTLGQSSTTLSGGEAQRVKLAAELAGETRGRSLFILDEPTTGLHFADVDRLLGVLHKIVDQGHTVLVIEHNLEVLRNADWIIDLGPEAGENGGRVVAAGTPAEVANNPKSVTGRYLQATST